MKTLIFFSVLFAMTISILFYITSANADPAMVIISVLLLLIAASSISIANLLEEILDSLRDGIDGTIYIKQRGDENND